MKYLFLVWRNLNRNRRRTLFTVLSITFSLLLLTLLRTLAVEFARISSAPLSVRRVIVRRSTSLAEMIPESYRRRIAGLPDVETLVGQNWFGGIYREPRNFFANFAVDHDRFFDVYPELVVAEEAKRAFLERRTSALCGARLAARYGWKTGDRITLLGSIYPVDLEFTLAGTYRSDTEENQFFFRRDYLEESLGRPGRVGIFVVVARASEAVPGLIERVDGMFRNTDAETLTETERAFQAGFQSMLGNVQGLLLSISSVVVFMILLVVGNTMAMSIRERGHEIAILKSMGFPNEVLMALLVGESVLLCLSGGLLGLAVAKALFRGLDLPRMLLLVREIDVSGATAALALGTSLAVGLVAGGIPALHVARLTVASGLRRLG